MSKRSLLEGSGSLRRPLADSNQKLVNEGSGEDRMSVCVCVSVRSRQPQ